MLALWPIVMLYTGKRSGLIEFFSFVCTFLASIKPLILYYNLRLFRCDHI